MIKLRINRMISNWIMEYKWKKIFCFFVNMKELVILSRDVSVGI